MMTKQPVFPLADTPDVDLEQAGGTNVVGGETFATAERIQFDSTSRAAITSAVHRVHGPSDRDRDRQPLRLWRHATKPYWAASLNRCAIWANSRCNCG
jgi:hypothetical protein